MNLVAYTRRSTEDQTDSQETQELLIRAWCDQHGHQLVRVYHEIPISGGKRIDRRPMLYQLMEDVKERRRDFDGLVVWKLDRLAREPGTEYIIIGVLEDHKCAIHSVTEAIDRSTAAGRFLYHNMMGVRAYEREITGERIYAHNLARAMSQKWPAGLPPLGYSYDPETERITVNDRASDAVAVFETYLHCLGNACQSARDLNAMGYTSRMGNPWRDDGVLLIIKSPIYRRRLSYDGQVFPAPDLIPELIPPDLLQRVDALLDAVGPLKTKQRRGVYAYSSLLTCSVCGSRMKHNGMAVHGAWVCRAKKESGTCDSRLVAARYVDRLVGEAVAEVFRIYQADLESDTQKPRKPPDKDKQRRELLARRDRVIRSYISRAINEAERDKYLGEIEAEGKKLDAPVKGDQPMTISHVRELIGALSADWPAIPTDEKRGLLLTIGARITVCTDRNSPLWIRLENTLPIGVLEVHAKERNHPKKRASHE